MDISEGNESIKPRTPGAACHLANFFAIFRDELCPFGRQLLGIDPQAHQSFRRLAPPVNPRNYFLTEIASLGITDRIVTAGLEQDIALVDIIRFGRDPRLDAGRFEGALADRARSKRLALANDILIKRGSLTGANE